MKSTSPDRMLRAIQEDEEAAEEGDDDDDTARGRDDKKQDHARDFGDEVFDVVNNNQGLTEEELVILSKMFM